MPDTEHSTQRGLGRLEGKLDALAAGLKARERVDEKTGETLIGINEALIGIEHATRRTDERLLRVERHVFGDEQTQPISVVQQPGRPGRPGRMVALWTLIGSALAGFFAAIKASGKA